MKNPLIFILAFTLASSQLFAQSHNTCKPLEIAELNGMKKADLRDELCMTFSNKRLADSFAKISKDTALEMSKIGNTDGRKDYVKKSELFEADSASCSREIERISRVMERRKIKNDCN